MTAKEQAYKILEKLVECFDDHFDEYKKGFYNETLTRVDYINPFFKTLGLKKPWSFHRIKPVNFHRLNSDTVTKNRYFINNQDFYIFT